MRGIFHFKDQRAALIYEAVDNGGAVDEPQGLGVSALPLSHSAHGIVQSPFCQICSPGPPVLRISTISPAAKLKNQDAFSR